MPDPPRRDKLRAAMRTSVPALPEVGSTDRNGSAAPPPTHEVGLAGEHYVAMRLAMVGITPAVLPARTPDADVIATLAGQACTLQVKTTGAAGRAAVDMSPDRIFLPDFLVIVALNMPGHYRA